MSTKTKPRKKQLILVVDDYTDNRELCADFLEYSGFDVAQAVSGSEAVEKASAQLPDLVLMDLSLPDVDGWEATRRLKKDPRTKGIPVIALTAHALEGHAKGARDAGCDGFLTKPCDTGDLLLEVRRVLEKGHGAK